MTDTPEIGECGYTSAGIQKYIQPLDIDVLTAAKERINHLIDTFDTLAVAFSGGKDSLTVLELVEEVYRERGITEKVKVFFRDEELIPDVVIDFVQKLYESGRFEFYYFAIPLKSTKFVLGRNYNYVQFDPNREWLRQPPPYAIRLEAGDKRVFDQYSADSFICSRFRGRVAIVTGIRAQESLIRFRACINKKNDNYINDTKDSRVKITKPIYDWTEDDIFKFFCRRKIQYCAIYDAQTWNGESLRVSTPLHAESAKRFNKLKTLYPKFYEGLITLFPEMLVQGAYYNELDTSGEFSQYEHTIDGLFKYINDKLDDPKQRALAIKRVCTSWKTRTKLTKGNPQLIAGYSLWRLFKSVQTGAYKREIMPHAATPAEYRFEGLEVPEGCK